MNKWKKITILLIITASLLFAGCTESNDEQKVPQVGPQITPELPTTTPKEVSIQPLPSTTVTKIVSDIPSKQNITLTANWCKIGEKITKDGQSMTITELRNVNGKELCYAQSTTGKTTATYYFSQDGKIKGMNSSSKSGNSSASANASTMIR